MSGDMTPIFPPEIFDAIIDHVYALKLNERYDYLDDDLDDFEEDGDESSDDQESLKVFIPVCKSWLPRSRAHLFQKVTFNRFTRTNAKPFIDLLDSPLCTFKPYVQILVLEERLGFQRTWLENALPSLSTLSAVRDLSIKDGIFTSQNSAFKLLPNFHNLKLLVLDDCRFGSSTQLLETLSICTSLKSIGLYDLRMSHSDPPCIANSPPPSSLTFIQIYNTGNNGDVIEWLVSGEQVPAIETLDLWAIQKDESRAVGHCLRRLGPYLKNLEVRFGTGGSAVDSENAFLRYVDLKYNTNLSSICFRSGRVPSFSLAQVTSSNVREVVVDVGFSTIQRRMAVDWDTIARILDQPNFSELEKFIMPGVPAHLMDKVGRWMAQRLPPGRAHDKLVLCEEWFENCHSLEYSGISYC